MKPRVDVIMDLETLGKKPGAVVLQLGMIAFDRDTGMTYAERGINIDIGSQLLLGMDVDQSTLLWWRAQSQEAQASVFNRGVPIKEAVEAFQDLWGTYCDETSALWARGTDFDPPIWEEAMKRTGVLIAPWRYDKKRDTRTALDVLGFDAKSVERPKAHQAVEDAIHDLHCLRLAGLFGKAPE